jgi:hypothetical protein
MAGWTTRRPCIWYSRLSLRSAGESGTFITLSWRTTMGKKRKKRMTPEERAALEAYSEDLDRRMLEMIERYKKLNAEKRAAREQA